MIEGRRPQEVRREDRVGVVDLAAREDRARVENGYLNERFRALGDVDGECELTRPKSSSGFELAKDVLATSPERLVLLADKAAFDQHVNQ
ncbi:MAG: hypothetical protein E6J25_05450 [Chloroflexi bacterium]|nr:MAG: hypothetical protein E6J25_05450 [Chloroflexota bacterium]